MDQDSSFQHKLDFIEAEGWPMHESVNLGIQATNFGEDIVNMFTISEIVSFLAKLAHGLLEGFAIAIRE